MAPAALRWLLFALCAAAAAERVFRYDYWWSVRAHGWFKLHVAPAAWHAAMKICHAEGGVLASPTDERLLAEMVRAAAVHNVSCALYTGIHATFAPGVYTSVEGVPLERMPVRWARDEPAAGDGEACVALRPDGRAAAARCDRALPFMCYKKMTKTDVLSGCGTVDGYYKLEPSTGSCYKFHWASLRWADAFMTCAMEGGHLAIVNSAAEDTLLVELFAKYPPSAIVSKHHKNYALLGFLDWNRTGEWFTVHGSTLDEAGYTTWTDGSPYDNMKDGVGAHCGAMTRTGQLFAHYCHLLTPFICEKSPDSLLQAQAADDDDL